MRSHTPATALRRAFISPAVAPRQVIIDTFFGFAPSLNASAPVLADPATPRGFTGTLTNVRLADGSVVNIVSDGGGVHVEAQ